MYFFLQTCLILWLPSWLNVKESACSAGDTRGEGSIPGLERSPGEGYGNPLQYSCLGNPTKESGRLQSIESQRVRQDLATEYPRTLYFILCLEQAGRTGEVNPALTFTRTSGAARVAGRAFLSLLYSSGPLSCMVPLEQEGEGMRLCT